MATVTPMVGQPNVVRMHPFVATTHITTEASAPLEALTEGGGDDGHKGQSWAAATSHTSEHSHLWVLACSCQVLDGHGNHGGLLLLCVDVLNITQGHQVVPPKLRLLRVLQQQRKKGGTDGVDIDGGGEVKECSSALL